MYCEICNKYVVSLGKHLCKCKDHNITPKEYYDKYLKKPNEGICPVCGKEPQFIKFSVGYNTHCSQYCTCHDKNVLDKRVDTLITNYGVDSPLKSNEIKNKVFTEEYSNIFKIEGATRMNLSNLELIDDMRAMHGFTYSDIAQFVIVFNMETEEGNKAFGVVNKVIKELKIQLKIQEIDKDFINGEDNV